MSSHVMQKIHSQLESLWIRTVAAQDESTTMLLHFLTL